MALKPIQIALKDVFNFFYVFVCQNHEWTFWYFNFLVSSCFSSRVLDWTIDSGVCNLCKIFSAVGLISSSEDSLSLEYGAICSKTLFLSLLDGKISRLQAEGLPESQQDFDGGFGVLRIYPMRLSGAASYFIIRSQVFSPDLRSFLTCLDEQYLYAYLNK